MRAKAFLIVSFASLFLSACDEPVPPAPQIRHVRTMVVARRVVSEPIVLTGQVKAQDEVTLSFRIDGKLVERTVAPGEKITTGQLIGRIDAQNEQNALEAANADIAAAQAALGQAEKLEARQAELLKRGITSRALYDQALQQFQTAQAQLESAQARSRTARNRLMFTELRAEIGGTVTAKGAESGEVVRAGQMIIRVAREDRKDAVFDVPAQLPSSRRIPWDSIVQVTRVDNPTIKATGHVREVSPQPDPVTRLFPVKIGLHNPPPEFALGVTVTGAISLDTPPVMIVPLTAIIESDNKPSVWVVDPANNAVALRPVEIMRYDPSAVIISGGLQEGEVVVTAGVHMLYPGQKVKLSPGLS
jgi:RND family efflux transporter MFP subunit